MQFIEREKWRLFVVFSLNNKGRQFNFDSLFVFCKHYFY